MFFGIHIPHLGLSAAVAIQVPDRPSEDTPRSRTVDSTRCVKRVNDGGPFRDTSSRVATVANVNAKRVCTVCGDVVRGGHPSSCNGPDQRFVTPEEWARMRRSLVEREPINIAKFREERNAARLAARDSREEVELL